MTEQERQAAAVEFPRQIAGTMARLDGLKRRLASQYDVVTTVLVLLERAMAAHAEPEGAAE
jgi:hypothetical protein